MSQGGEEKKVYGTFEGQQQQYYPQPSIGFPQPVPPPGLSPSSASPSPYYPPPPGYQAGYPPAHGYAVVEGRPMREPRLPCCGIGIGWLMFLLGFFLAAIPWYVGAAIIVFGRVDYREKPGYVACTIAAVLATITAVFGVSKGVHDM